MKKDSQIALINAEINKELDAETGKALLVTTFSGLNATTMKQAIMEGMIRGFTFKNFLEKDVYAIPFGQKYSLVTSIDYMRKIASKSGLAGKSAPKFIEGANKTLESCSIIVKKVLTNGEIGEFESLVYLSEYTTTKNLWVTKPRTMLAKVAEMHALRMAFPEELSKAYIEEEFKQSATEAKVALTQEQIDKAKKELDDCTTVKAYDKTWKDFSKEIKENEEVVDHALNTRGLINESKENENS